MREFKITPLPRSETRVDRLIEALGRFDLQPEYQRQSDIWSEEKRQLFVESLINGYDVPKLYFQRLPEQNAETPQYAIIDGKQRLETIDAFFRGKFPLSDDFTDASMESEPDAAAGLTYTALTQKFPTLAARFEQYELDIIVIETLDEGIIEELFSRLNESVPLNAPEKRNALRGAMPPIIRRLVARHTFFGSRLPIENTRYRQYDLVTKFLFLTDKTDFVSTKKRALDEFVKSYRDARGKPVRVARARKLNHQVSEVLDRMAAIFAEQDELLISVGLVTVYFMAFLLAARDHKLAEKLTRPRLLAVDPVLTHHRLILRTQQAAIARGSSVAPTRGNRELAIFDRLMQSPNDGQALEYRYKILRAFLFERRFSEALPRELRQRIGDG